MALKTYNQISVPAFMYGTAWKKDATTRLVQLAVASGFRAIDTANQLIHYQEALVGEALQALAGEGYPRESLFLQTKFTPLGGQGGHPPYDPSADLTTQVNQSFESSLSHLHTDYLDSYVLHSPYSRRGLGEADWEVWAAMEALYDSGKTKMIGVSNISASQLTELCERAKVKPMMAQNRCFAALGWDFPVREVCRTHGVIYQGFSLLTANVDVLRSREIGALAKRLDTGPAQVIFRFAMDVGMLPLTGTTSERHMKDDLKAADLVLSEDEVRLIETIAL
ncbi:MAG TPA: aldo/keto reductase [Verrucomicrobiae bacterium]|nr:aldo/keto reductase [Verrucomicrobiae bacterium]